MRQLRVENTLYDLPDEVWRQVNDLLGKAEGTKQLTQEMLNPDLSSEGSDGPVGSGSGSGPESPKPLGEDLSEEEQP